MENLGIRDIFYVIMIIVAAVSSFQAARFGLKNLIKDKNHEVKKEINDLKIEIERLKGKDGLQQQVIDQFKEVIFDWLDSQSKRRKSDDKK